MEDNVKTGNVKKELVVEKADLPLRVTYASKRYVLILTRNDKLILNKATE
jgi:hypothetical protein